ncbi:hypothetical protein AGMMS50212_14370 [Spirochaetia bacterium]|nr:hypothetical protein AGMMS50212_14370 [Spirochaetia bacterium]
MIPDEKYEKLQTIIKEQGSVAVAFSGGVDSSFLCYAAHSALGKNAIAITIVSPMLPQTEIDFAKKIASSVGIRHILIEENHIDEVVASNPKDRCYYCKKMAVQITKKLADIEQDEFEEFIAEGEDLL